MAGVFAYSRGTESDFAFPHATPSTVHSSGVTMTDDASYFARLDGHTSVDRRPRHSSQPNTSHAEFRLSSRRTTTTPPTGSSTTETGSIGCSRGRGANGRNRDVRDGQYPLTSGGGRERSRRPRRRRRQLCPGRTSLVDVDDVSAGKMRLPDEPPANSQRVGINWHTECALDTALGRSNEAE